MGGRGGGEWTTESQMQKVPEHSNLQSVISDFLGSKEVQVIWILPFYFSGFLFYQYC